MEKRKGATARVKPASRLEMERRVLHRERARTHARDRKRGKGKR
jgi:hypothetical protein